MGILDFLKKKDDNATPAMDTQPMSDAPAAPEQTPEMPSAPEAPADMPTAEPEVAPTEESASSTEATMA